MKKGEQTQQPAQEQQHIPWDSITGTIVTGLIVLSFISFAGTITQSYLHLEEHKMDATVAAETAKAYAIRDVAIVALQQKLTGSFNASANAVIQCDYDGWKTLPVTINKTTDLARALGMLPDKANCVVKATGGFGGTGSIPVALMDEETMNYIRTKAEVLS